MVGKYVLAGGPGSGKSKSISCLQKNLLEKGYKVYVVQETARQLIEAGLERNNPDFPYYNFSLMLYKELMFEKIARSQKENVIILCDRGRMDPKAYRGQAIFEDILKKYGFNSEMDVINSYDGVIFLQTAAEGLENEYVKDLVRTESVVEAVEMQDKLLNVWERHPNFRFIHNYNNFSDKVKKIEETIVDFIHQKNAVRLTSRELIEYANGLSISEEEMLKTIEEVLLDKKIINRNSCFEH